MPTKERTTSRLSALTNRQRQIVALLADHHPAKEIAARLEIGESRVYRHVRAIKDRLGTERMSEIVAIWRAAEGGEKPAPRKSDLPPLEWPTQEGVGSEAGVFRFADAQTFGGADPFYVAPSAEKLPDPAPGALEGRFGTLKRLGYVVAVAFGTVATSVLVLTAMSELTALLG